jgi:hypothetical protein
MINKIIIVGFNMRRMKMMGGLLFHKREGSKGDLFMGINPNHFPELLSLCITFYLLLNVLKDNH